MNQASKTVKDSNAVRGMHDALRAMPESLEAEAAVLGSMLLDPVCINEVVGKLKADDFYRVEHRIIFEAIIGLYEKNKGIGVDAVLLRSELGNLHRLDEAGGVEYLSKLMNSVPSSANVMWYANVVKDKSLIRDVINVASQILEDGFNGTGETSEKLDRAEQLIFSVTNKKISTSAEALKDLVVRSYELIEKRDGRHITGLATGFHELDQLMCGLQNGEMIIVAGRPSMGKTSLALNMAEHIGVVEKIPLAIFSLEMGRQQLAERFLCSRAAVDAQLVRKGILDTEHHEQLIRGCGELSEAPIYIDDTAALTPLELRAKARRLKSQYQIRCVIVDYLQLMNSGIGRIESRQQEITLISRYLKAMARELDMPVVVLSQLNRSPEGRENHTPRISDLRESGSIEQDADVVILLHREDYYHLNETDYTEDNMADVIIAKQRNGPTGNTKLVFRKKFTRFENASHLEDPF